MSRITGRDGSVIPHCFFILPAIRIRALDLPCLFERLGVVMESTSPLRILFLDDDADTREMVTVLLAQSGIDVLSVQSCGEALHLANTGAFDALFSTV